MLLRGGRLEIPPELWPAAEAVGEGVRLEEVAVAEAGAAVESGLEESGAWCMGIMEMGISTSVAMAEDVVWFVTDKTICV